MENSHPLWSSFRGAGHSGADLFTVTHPTNNDSGSRPVTTYGNYDGVGRPRTITDPAGKDTTYTYDALGRVLTVTLPKPTPAFAGNFTTAYSYDNFDSGTGLVFTQITDPNGRITKLHYDEHGRLLKSVDAASNTTNYGYTRDVLTSITDANDNATTYHYDPLKRLDKTTFPDGKFETYTYYADGLLKTKTDRMGQTLTYEYDAFKRLKKKIYPNPAQTITYTYQGQKLTQVDDLYASPAETHTFQYDSSYRVWQNGQSTRGTLTYTYTPDDRVDTMTIAGTPNVTTAHTYYADGSLKTIVWSPQTGQFKYDYTARGQYQTVTFPNGQTRSYSYDDQGRLTNLANALGATNIATYAYGYDVDWASGLNTMLGQRVSMTAAVPSQGFNGALTKYSYDPLYQLKKAEYPNVAPFNNEVHQWTYDAIGNRLTNQVNATTQTYTYEKIGTNPKNAQKLLGDGVNTYAYDFNGSQTSRTGFGFVNDPDNRLASINGNETASYMYDYQGRRSSKTVAGVTTKYLYDGLNLVSETTAGATTRYAFGPSIDEPLAAYTSGAVSYLNADGLGSIVATNSAAGAVGHNSIFDAWGVVKSETGTRTHSFTYTGREVGEAGLHFYRARWLQPGVGMFGSTDPLYSPVSIYTYGASSPIDSYDPLGWVAIKFTYIPRNLGPLASGRYADPGINANKDSRRVGTKCECINGQYLMRLTLDYTFDYDCGGEVGCEREKKHAQIASVLIYKLARLWNPVEAIPYPSRKACEEAAESEAASLYNDIFDRTRAGAADIWKSYEGMQRNYEGEHAGTWGCAVFSIGCNPKRLTR